MIHGPRRMYPSVSESPPIAVHLGHQTKYNARVTIEGGTDRWTSRLGRDEAHASLFLAHMLTCSQTKTSRLPTSTHLLRTASIGHPYI